MATDRDDVHERAGKRIPANKESASDADAESILTKLASVFLGDATPTARVIPRTLNGVQDRNHLEQLEPNRADMYRILVEQIPAIVFIAYLDGGLSEAYVSPHIEATLGYSQTEWLEDPIRWYDRIHPDDRQRWSTDAAQMFLTGEPLRAVYRVVARNGKVVWFHCEAKMVRRPDGRPWFLHGVGFDISDLKQTEEALQSRTSSLQNLSAHILRLQDEERRRISRELHDSLGQYLSALKMNLDLLGSPGNAAGDRLLLELKRLADCCINETRTISYLLHPPVLDQLGFSAAAHWYVEGFAKRSGIKMALDLPPNLGRLPDAIELTLFRILQESLANIHRHSESSSAEIHLLISGSEICLQIRDHGHGMPRATLQNFQQAGTGTGVGLSGMRERVSDLGGRLEINSDTEGTIVSVSIPISVAVEAVGSLGTRGDADES